MGTPWLRVTVCRGIGEGGRISRADQLIVKFVMTCPNSVTSGLVQRSGLDEIHSCVNSTRFRMRLDTISTSRRFSPMYADQSAFIRENPRLVLTVSNGRV